MKRSIKRSLSFVAAVAVGALAFGVFWSVQVHARTVGGGPFCNPPAGATQNEPMCYKGSNVSAPPATQSSYLNMGQADIYCGTCHTSGN